jgi:twitching motility protein PilT
MNPAMPTAEKLDQILRVMVHSSEGISDLLFVPGKPPQIEAYGELETPPLEWPAPPDDAPLIEALARVIIDGSEKLQRDLDERGSCDCSYTLRDYCRFRVSIYRQYKKIAMVLRQLKPLVPTIDGLGLEPVFYDVIRERNGITFVTGASGNGKTTTLAALMNEINRTSKVHVITLEDPVEFLHPHQRSTFSQRELGHDFFSFAEGLKSALRQAPKIILVGEIRDRETMEIALTASETGVMIYSTLHTINASQTIHRILGMFSKDEEHQIRERLAGAMRYVIGQRLVPKKAGGRLLVTEVMGHNLRTREAVALGENDARRLPDIIESSKHAGWHAFEHSLMKAYEQDLITEETAMLYATNKPLMRQMVDTARSRPGFLARRSQASPMIVVPSAPKPSAKPNPPDNLANIGMA